MQQLRPLPQGIRLLSDPEGDRLAKLYPPTVIPPPSKCITCSGTKTFKWWVRTNGERVIDTWECNCIDQWKAHQYFLHSGIGVAYQRLDWFDAVTEPDANKVVADYLDNASGYVENGIGLIFRGTNGSGKTLLTTLLLKTLLARGFDGYFTTFGGLIEMFTSGWRNQDEKQWFHKRIQNAHVLVVDDMGKEGRRGEGLPMTVFDEVLRRRVAQAQPTFLTTNLSMEMVERTYGSSAMSLLSGCSIEYEFKGEDFRPKYQSNLIEDTKLGLKRPIFT